MKFTRETLRETLKVSVAASAMAAAFALTPAGAQQGGVDAGARAAEAFDNVVVTARRRSESLQDVPESVTAFSAAEIERAGISSLRDVADLTPNLSQLDNFRPGLARIQIRGVITPQLGEAPIAYVVDGVTASDLEFMNQELVDIERIEVLRGAQGALYGRGAIGGAINIVTKKPTNETEAQAVLSYGSGDDMRVSGVVSGALSEDGVFYRVGGYSRSYDGQITDSFQNTEVDFHDETSLFVKLMYELDDGSSIDVNARHTTTEAGMGYYESTTAATLEDFSGGPSHNVPGADERDVTEFSVRYRTELDIGTLELVAAMSESEQDGFSDADYTANESDFDNFFYAGAQENLLDVEALTIESRLTSSDDTDLRWSLAAFFQDRDRLSTFRWYGDFVGTSIQRRGDFGFDAVETEIIDDNNSQAWGLAAQFNYDVSDAMELTAALRYDEDERTSLGSLRVYDYDNFVLLPAEEESATETYDELQPKVSLAYKVSDNTLVYGGYSRGFRSGGFNEMHPDISRTFGKETSDSFEAGFKTTLSGGAVLNGAVFQIDQENAQITRFNADTFTLENITIDDVSSFGVEFEYARNLSDRLALGMTGGLIESEINAFALRPDLVGKSVPHVAEYSATASLEYNAPLSNGRSLFIRGDVQHTGPRNLSIDVDENASNIESSARTFVNLRVSVEMNRGAVTLFANDLTDERQVEDLVTNSGLYRLSSSEPSFGLEYRTGF